MHNSELYVPWNGIWWPRDET